jgi:hypothetical protein
MKQSLVEIPWPLSHHLSPNSEHGFFCPIDGMWVYLSRDVCPQLTWGTVCPYSEPRQPRKSPCLSSSRVLSRRPSLQRWYGRKGELTRCFSLCDGERPQILFWNRAFYLRMSSSVCCGIMAFVTASEDKFAALQNALCTCWLACSPSHSSLDY